MFENQAELSGTMGFIGKPWESTFEPCFNLFGKPLNQGVRGQKQNLVWCPRVKILILTQNTEHVLRVGRGVIACEEPTPTPLYLYRSAKRYESSRHLVVHEKRQIMKSVPFSNASYTAYLLSEDIE